MTVGGTAKLKAEASTPRALARASGSAFAVLSADCASPEVADPRLVTVTEASTLERVLLVLSSESETPSKLASADESTVGAASDALEEASTSWVTVKLADGWSPRPWMGALDVLSVRREASAIRLQPVSSLQMFELRATRNCSTVTPDGIVEETLEGFVIITSTSESSPDAAADDTAPARVEASIEAAAALEIATTEVVA